MISDNAIEIAKDLVGVAAPVRVERPGLAAGNYAARYAGPVLGVHVVYIRADLPASNQHVLLLHELVHARQCEQLSGWSAFQDEYYAQLSEAGLTWQDVGGREYRNIPLEREAYQVSADLVLDYSSRVDVCTI